VFAAFIIDLPQFNLLAANFYLIIHGDRAQSSLMTITGADKVRTLSLSSRI